MRDNREIDIAGGTREIQIEAPRGQQILRACALVLIAGAVLLAWAIGLQVGGGATPGLRAGLWVAGIVLAVFGGQLLRGLTLLSPGDAVVVQLFGTYAGTIRGSGVHWVQPWARRRRISVRLRTHSTGVAKVNDGEGNPIEVSIVVVWQIDQPARAVYDVEDIEVFVPIQCDSALREVASRYRYDSHGDGGPCLCDSSGSGGGEVTDQLTREIAARVALGGVEVIESRIVHLAYAPEIAQAMLRRQQAGAIVAARTQIVDGAVGMVELALHRLDEENVVDLDEERRAAMVSNLLVVLCSDHPTQPIVNAGSLYH